MVIYAEFNLQKKSTQWFTSLASQVMASFTFAALAFVIAVTSHESNPEEDGDSFTISDPKLTVNTTIKSDNGASESPSPTWSPTVLPAILPSSSPTLQLNSNCDRLDVDISDLHEISAAILIDNTTLQIIMAHITHEAIAQSTAELDNPVNFSVEFVNASESLFITFRLCASSQQNLIVVEYVIRHHTTDITDAVCDGIFEQFQLDESSVEVTISVPQFSLRSLGEH